MSYCTHSLKPFQDIVAYAIAFVAAYLQDSGQHTIKFTYAFHRAELVGEFIPQSPPSV